MSTRPSLLAFALAALAPLSFAHTAHAQQHSKLDDPYIAAKLQLGFGGSATSSVDTSSGTTSTDRSLQASLGLAGQYTYPLHPYFALGGSLGFLSWRSTSDGNGGRNFLFDLAVVPQGRYVLLDGSLEVYAGLPLGLGLDVLNEVDASNTWFTSASGANAGGQVEGNAAVGFEVGFLVGSRYQLASSVGLLLELGYMYRTFGHTVTTSVGANSGLVSLGGSGSRDVNISFGQFVLNLGAYF